MKIVNRYVVLTIMLNFLSPIGVGHGFTFLGLMEIIGLKQFIQGDVKFSLIGNNDDRIFTTATIAAVGQIILTVAYFNNKQIQKFKAVYIGLFILLLSYFLLSIEFSTSTFDYFSFWAGTPFFVSAILLLVVTIKNQKFTKKP
jgi:hypothetical protein